MFLIVRGIVYSAGFVFLWAWLAVQAARLDARLPFELPRALRPAGYLIGVAGALLAAWCILTFLTRGRGTPAPFDPPREFVAGGPYRFVRNPMYIGAIGVLAGGALAASSPGVLLLAMLFWLLMHLLVVLYEEPTLAESFGESYQGYRRAVSRWWISRPRGAGGA